MKLEDITDFKEFVPRTQSESQSVGDGPSDGQDASTEEQSFPSPDSNMDYAPFSPVYPDPNEILMGKYANVSSSDLLEYFEQLITERRKLEGVGYLGLTQVQSLLEHEINEIRQVLAAHMVHQEPVPSPVAAPLPPMPTMKAELHKITLTEKVPVPTDEYPDYNFAGRILGPRGMTVKQVERETGCRIQVRGKGSMKTPTGNECDQENLHVLITVEDFPQQAQFKLEKAKAAVTKLITPGGGGMDNLKRRQLMELAIINGNYRPSKSTIGGDVMPPMAAPTNMPMAVPPSPRMVDPSTLAAQSAMARRLLYSVVPSVKLN